MLSSASPGVCAASWIEKPTAVSVPVFRETSGTPSAYPAKVVSVSPAVIFQPSAEALTVCVDSPPFAGSSFRVVSIGFQLPDASWKLTGSS